MLEQQQIQRLLDIAFLGCHKGQAGLSRIVIQGLDQVLENSVELEICRAMSFYTVDQFEEARQILSEALDKFPGDAMVLTHTALVEILEGNINDAKEKLGGVIAENKDPEAVELAEKLLKAYC